MTKITSEINRKTASKILGVSVRTIDRYIRSGKLFAREENGRIWLNKKDISNFSHLQLAKEKSSIDKPFYGRLDRPVQQKINDSNFYKDLYEEAKRALADYQQKLEQSNYRIGQLESQNLHTSHPKPIERIERREDYFTNELIKKDLLDKEKEILALKELINREKTSRIIFAVITYILLALLPVFWYLLR